MASHTARRLLSVPIVAATLGAGVWVAGGLLTNDFRASVALTTVWMLLAGAACLIVAVRAPALALPVLGSYALAAAAIGGYLGLTTLRDRVVDEPVVTGAPRTQPAPAAPQPAPAAPRPAPAAPRPANVELARGRFRSGEHATSGTAAVVRVADGRRLLTLTSFSTSPGPDLRVRLVRAGETVDLGALKGNRGNQQYRIPRSVGIEGRTVVIWCRAFSVRFGSARLA